MKMSCECIPQLEDLITGKTNSIEIIRTDHVTSEHILKELNKALTSFFPSTVATGCFINKDSSEYLIYEMRLISMKASKSLLGIRLFDFGNIIRLDRL